MSLCPPSAVRHPEKVDGGAGQCQHPGDGAADRDTDGQHHGIRGQFVTRVTSRLVGGQMDTDGDCLLDSSSTTRTSGVSSVGSVHDSFLILDRPAGVSFLS